MESSRLEFYQTDCEIILSHLKHNEQQLQLKRRWLMGLPISKSQKKKLLRYRSLPESLLREDDIFYDTVRKHVEEAFGVNNGVRESIFQETEHLFNKSNLKGILLSCINALTNKGLFLLVMLLARGSVNFEKTRPKMKKMIIELIPGIARDQNHEVQTEILTQLSQLLKEPQNVRDGCLTLMFPTVHSHHAAATQILDRLEDLPSETLLAMRRKLRGLPTRAPCLQQTRHGLSRATLIDKVRKTSEKMLSELVRGNELQAPLAKALAVAGLSLQLILGYSNSSTSDFDQFSPEIKTLQNEIAKAIWLLKYKTKVRLPELKTLQLLLDPDANIPNAFLRTAIKKMLTEYLFECNDLDTIPKSLSDALAIINRRSRSMPSGCFLKDEIEEEVDCILSLSAQMKQIFWDLLPDHDFDEDFANIYTEELEESDDGGDDNYDYHDANDTAAAASGDDAGQQLQSRNNFSSSRSVDFDNQEESCGEHIPVDSKPSISNLEESHYTSMFLKKRNFSGIFNAEATPFKVENMDKFGTSRINGNGFPSSCSPHERSHTIPVEGNEPEQSTRVDSGNPPSSSFGSKGKKFMLNGHSASTNLYLGVQNVCDDASMVAYKLIGYMMEKFTQEEGLDLDWSDGMYLRGDNSNLENQEERQRQTTSERNAAGSVIVQAVEELVPSLPKSGMQKLKELIGDFGG